MHYIRLNIIYVHIYFIYRIFIFIGMKKKKLKQLHIQMLNPSNSYCFTYILMEII